MAAAARMAGVVAAAGLTAAGLAAGLLAGLLTGLLADARPSVAQSEPDWPRVKCERYARAWNDALARRGRDGLTAGFVDAHEAFLASGCTARADVCPRSPKDFDMANLLTVLAMNAGTASTFLPFACRGAGDPAGPADASPRRAAP